MDSPRFVIALFTVGCLAACTATDPDEATGSATTSAIEAAPTTEVADDLDLESYYADIVGAEPERAKCLADAAGAEGVDQVGQLEEAEFDPARSERIADAQAAC